MFVQTVTDFKVHVTNGSSTLDRKLDKIETMMHSRLDSEVGELKCEIQRLNNKISHLEELIENRVVSSVSTVDYPRVNSDQNPFAHQTLGRNVMAPSKKGNSLQFRWKHYEHLCKEVQSKLGKPYRDEYLMTFKKNAGKYAAGLVENLRIHHNLDSSTTWADLTEKIRREAEALFEQLVGDEFPLCACVENALKTGVRS